MPEGIDRQGHHYRYQIIDMHQIDCSVFLTQDKPEALILAILCDFKHKNKRQVIREILTRLQQLTRNNETQYRDCLLMLEVLSENRNLSHEIKEEERMLSAIKLEDLPSYEIGIERGFERGIERGIEKGFEDGVEKNQIQTVLKAHKAGLSVDKISQITGLSETAINQILTKI